MTIPSELESTVSLAGRWGRTVILAAMAMLLLVALGSLDKSLYKNDPINRLGSGYDIGGGDPDVRRFFAAAVENCRMHAEAAGDLPTCINYQRVILQNIFFNYPITSLFGYRLQHGYGAGSFLGDTSRALVWSAVAGSLAAAILALLILWPMPPAPLAAVAVALLAGALVQHVGGRSALKLGAPAIVHSMVTVVILAVAAGVLAIALGRLRRTPDPSPSVAAKMPWLPWALVALVALLFVGRSTGVAREAFQIVALAVFVGLFMSAAVQARIPAVVAVTMALVMFGMVTHDYGLRLEIPKQQGFLVFVAGLVYVAVRPRGRWIWLLPASLLFQASSAGLTAVAILAAELVLCLRRRRLSHLVGATLATAIPAALLGLGRPDNPLVSVGNTDVVGLLHRVLASGAFLPTLCAVVLLLVLASAILARRDESWDVVAFFALLLAGIVVAEATGAIIHKADVLTDAFFLPAMAHKYLAALNLGTVLGLLALLVDRAATPDPARAFRALAGREWLVPALAVVCLVIAQAPRLSAVTGGKSFGGLAVVVRGEMPAKWSSLAVAAGDDDDYYLDSDNPKNGPMTYFSLLKMKVRKATGRFASAGMRVLVLENGTPVKVPQR